MAWLAGWPPPHNYPAEWIGRQRYFTLRVSRQNLGSIQESMKKSRRRERNDNIAMSISMQENPLLFEKSREQEEPAWPRLEMEDKSIGQKQ